MRKRRQNPLLHPQNQPKLSRGPEPVVAQSNGLKRSLRLKPPPHEAPGVQLASLSRIRWRRNAARGSAFAASRFVAASEPAVRVLEQVDVALRAVENRSAIELGFSLAKLL